MKNQIVNITSEQALNSKSENVFETANIVVTKTLIPLNHETAKVVYFVDTKEGDSIDSFADLYEACECAKESEMSLAVADVDDSIIKDMKQRLQKQKDINNMSLAERMTIAIDDAARRIEYKVTINNQKFDDAFSDFLFETTMGKENIAKVQKLALALIERHRDGMKMYKKA